MMNIHGAEYEHVCIPVILHNEERLLRVHVKLATLPQINAAKLSESTMDVESAGKSMNDFIDARIIKFEVVGKDTEGNEVQGELKIGGKSVTTYAELLKTGVYHELVAWCRMAVMSERVLSESELKN